jgi:hypothetical protein
MVLLRVIGNSPPRMTIQPEIGFLPVGAEDAERNKNWKANTRNRFPSFLRYVS